MSPQNTQNRIRPSTPARDDTRQSLIQAGLDLFGRHGFEAATTRMLSQRAGANLAAIPYHFGSKEGLYHAVIQHITDRVLEDLREEREEVFAVLQKEKATRKELLAALERILRAFARFVISTGTGGQFGPIIMREQMRPSDAFDRIYMAGMKPLHEAITALVGRLSGTHPQDRETIIRAHSILGQVVAFRAMRELALRRLGWEDFDEENVDKVCDVVVENLHRILSGRGRK